MDVVKIFGAGHENGRGEILIPDAQGVGKRAAGLREDRLPQHQE